MKVSLMIVYDRFVTVQHPHLARLSQFEAKTGYF